MKQVRNTMEMLDMYPHGHLSTGKVRKLPDSDDFFIMKADSDIRTIIRMTGPDKEVTDIVRYERLNSRYS